jgi:hypothetical protein
MHAISSPGVTMDYQQPDDLFEQVFTEFMTDQATRLSPESYRQYAMIIDLLEIYQDRYRSEYRHREYETMARPDGAFRGVSEAIDLTRRFSTFLRDFLPHEIDVSPATLRTARMVIKEFGAWLAAKGYVVRNQLARKRKGSKRPPYLPGFFQD